MNNNAKDKLSGDLIDEIVNDSDNKLSLLYSIYSSYINAVCKRHKGYEIDEDLRQEIMLAIYKAIKKFKLRE